MIFTDLFRIYNIYHIAVNKLVKSFKKMNGKKKSAAYELYEKFLDFNKKYKSLLQSYPVLLGIKVDPQTLYTESTETTMKLKKQMKASKAKKENVENFDDWEEAKDEQNLSEEFDFEQL